MPLLSGWKSRILAAVFIFSGAFLFVFWTAGTAQAAYATSSYQKNFNDTLSAQNWNDLFFDYVNTWTGTTMTGPLGIGTTTPPSSGLFVNGPIWATNFFGTYTGTIGARNVSNGEFGSDSGGGNYYFGLTGLSNGSVGIGTANTAARLNVQGTSTNDIINLFDNTGAEKFTVLSTGSVGIGTTNPDSMLTLGGTAHGYIRFKGPTINEGNIYHDATYGLHMDTSANALPIRIDGSALILGMNGNVGIGTTNPGAKLDIVGTLKSNSAVTFTGLGSSGNVMVMSDNSGTLYSTSTAVMFPVGSSTLPFGTSGQTLRHNGTVWTADSNLYNNGTQVGVGTTNPSAQLHLVKADSSGLNDILVNPTIKTSGNLLNLQIGGVTKFSVNYAGGTTINDRLYLYGLAGTYPGFISYTNSDTNWHGLFNSSYRSRGTISAPTAVINGDSVMYYDQWGYDGSSYQRGAQFMSYVDGAVSAGVVPMAWSWNTMNASGVFSTKLNINSSGLVTIGQNLVVNGAGNSSFAGSVGIGTTNPGTKLDLPTGALRALSATVSGLGGSNNVFVMSDNSGGLFATSTASVLPQGSVSLPAGILGSTLYHNGTLWVASTTPLYNNGTSVGIGTTNPQDKLDVYGNIRFQDNSAYYLLKRANTVQPLIKTSRSDDTQPGLFRTNGWGDYTFDRSVGIGYDLSGAAYGAGNLFVSGNVGIGATTSSARLHSLATTEQLRLGYNTTNYNSFTVGSTGSLNIAAVGTNPNITLTPGGTGYTILNGFVGIGTTTPGVKLDLPTGALRALSATVSGLGGSGNVLVMADNSGGFYSVINPSGSTILPSGTSGATLRHNGTLWVASTTPLYNNGTSVGIGTTNPLFPLHVYGATVGSYLAKFEAAVDGFTGLDIINNNNTANSYAVLSVDSPTTQIQLRMYPANTTQYFNTYNSATSSLAGYGWLRTGSQSLGLLVGTDSVQSAPIVFATSYGGMGRQERMRIDSGGNIGIGTTNPGAKFDVNGDVLLEGGARTLTFSGGAGTIQTAWEPINIYADSDNNGSGNLIQLGGNGTSSYLVIDNGGNVGIGTTNPGTKLDLPTGALRALSATVSGLGGSNNVFVMSDNSGGLFATSTASVLPQGSVSLPAGILGSTLYHNGTLWVASTTPLYNNGTSVGIGTTNPGAKLDVYGASGDIYSRVISGSGVQVQTIASTNSYGWIGTLSNHPFYIGTNNGGKLYLSAAGGLALGTYVGTDAGAGNLIISGSVGIGTTAPDTKFHVEGDANIGDTVAGGTARTLFVQDKINIIHSGSNLFATIQGPLNRTLRIDLPGNTTDDGFLIRGSQDSGSTYPNNVFFAGANGFVGIGTTTPSVKLDIPTGALRALSATVTGLGSSGNVVVMADNTGGLYSTTTASFISGNSLDLWKGAKNGNIWNGDAGLGNVGIGTTNPGAYKLKVVGNVAITGTLETQTGSDFAEEFKTDALLEPGTVVVMGDYGYKSAKPSTKKYDNKVIGVVSDNPSIIAGRSSDPTGYKAIVAMVGVVKVKVSAVNGTIVKGDLLTTSPITGQAMKASVNKQGTIIGKALEDLVGESGEIKALVNLQ